MSAGADLINAVLDLGERSVATRPYLDFIHQHGIDRLHVAGFCGTLGVATITAYPNEMFDFADDEAEGCFLGVVCEAFDADGETALDLIAWPLDEPFRVLSMFRRAGLVGLWQAMNPFSYTLGMPLPLHRHPLDWLKAGCDGAAIAVPHLAARQLLDLPGRFAPRDRQHAREIDILIKGLAKDRMVVPRQRRAAA